MISSPLKGFDSVKHEKNVSTGTCRLIFQRVVLSVGQIRELYRLGGFCFLLSSSCTCLRKPIASQKHLGKLLPPANEMRVLAKLALTTQNAEIKQKKLADFLTFQLFVSLSNGKRGGKNYVIISSAIQCNTMRDIFQFPIFHS